MKKLYFNRWLIFILQSIGAGLALAFLFIYYFPEILLTSNTNSDNIVTISEPGLLDTGPVSYRSAVSKTAPAVVNVYATKVVNRKIHPLLRDPIFRQFFGIQEPEQQRNTNLGSGVIMNAEGYIITNAHVIKEANEILITLADGRQAEAVVIGVDSDTDLAVLDIDLDNLPSISIGSSDNISVGDVVLAIGNPYDFGQTVTQGIISAIGRKRRGIGAFTDDFIQTDADINFGNSGGALVNATGQLIGINTLIFSTTGGSQGIGLAIPINLVVGVMNALAEYGHVVRGWLGIVVQVEPTDTADPSGRQQSGVLVFAVENAGPAALAGIIPGDILVEINSIPINDPNQAIHVISQIQPGTVIEVVVVRGFEELVLEAKITQRPSM